MKQVIKQFLKPNWKKIIITIILALPSLIMWGCESDFNLFNCSAIILKLVNNYFGIFYFLITYPVFLILRLLALLELEISQITVILFFIIYLIYWYLLLSLIAWLHNKHNMIKDNPLMNKILKIVLIALFSILSIISALFSVGMLGWIGSEPSVGPDSPSSLLFTIIILLIIPFIFIYGILWLLRIKWAWKFFLGALIGVIFYAVLNFFINLDKF